MPLHRLQRPAYQYFVGAANVGAPVDVQAWVIQRCKVSLTVEHYRHIVHRFNLGKAACRQDGQRFANTV